MISLSRSTFLAMALLAAAGGPALAQQSGGPLDCVIAPSRTVEVGSPSEGVLAEILVDRGDHVRKGDVIARLRAEVEAANVELAKVKAENDADIKSGESRVAFYRRQHERAQQLFERKVYTAEAIERAETEMLLAENDLLTAQYQQRLAKAELRRARVVLAQKTVRSPMDGVVTERLLEPGNFVYNKAGIVKLANVDPLYVRAYAPVPLYPVLRRAAYGVVTPQAPFDRPHHAGIAVLDAVFDVASETFGIRLELPNPEGEIPAGIKCRVEFADEAVTSN